MKLNAQDQQLTRVRILEAAVDVITIKGFKSATMREIAKQAQVGDATIYNYFPTKEKLLYGYCEYVQQQVLLELKEISDFTNIPYRSNCSKIGGNQSAGMTASAGIFAASLRDQFHRASGGFYEYCRNQTPVHLDGGGHAGCGD